VATERQLTDQGKERKQQLLDAARDLFAERGYHPTRVIDICQRAGVAKGLFYWYFETKEALFAELNRSMRQRLRRSQAQAMEGAEDPVERLRRGTEASVRFMAEHSSWFSLLDAGSGDDRLAPAVLDGSGVYRSDTENLIRLAQQSGGVPEDIDPRLAALGVLATVTSYGQYVRSGRVTVPIDELARFVGDWVVRAVGARTVEVGVTR